MGQIRVAVHATDPISLAGVVSQLRVSPEVEVLTARRAEEAEVLVVCASGEVLPQLRRVTAACPARVVLVTSGLPESDLLGAVECGVACVVPTAEATGDRLVAAVREVLAGGGELPTDLVAALLEQVKRLQRDVLVPHGLTASGLSPREVDVLRLMAQGKGTAEIAQELVYSERTVKNIVYSLMNRLNLRNRPHAVAYALRAGII
ncbi:response regulator transcription factor [Actinosynnema sp. NPDC053489]|uniref:response regulator transcription factor n=1 Tax=Actinosynnema sp. NPDC053489 TaxID=3363916 RepID=UPI0037C769E7